MNIILKSIIFFLSFYFLFSCTKLKTDSNDITEYVESENDTFIIDNPNNIVNLYIDVSDNWPIINDDNVWTLPQAVYKVKQLYLNNIH